MLLKPSIDRSHLLVWSKSPDPFITRQRALLEREAFQLASNGSDKLGSFPVDCYIRLGNPLHVRFVL
jgi:hypothetical protein